MQISMNSHLGGGRGRRLEGAREGLTIGLGTTGRRTNSPGVTPLGAVGEPLVGKGMVQGSRLGESVEVGMGRWEGRQEKGPPSWSSRRPWDINININVWKVLQPPSLVSAVWLWATRLHA